jgi:hypothetical protein
MRFLVSSLVIAASAFIACTTDPPAPVETKDPVIEKAAVVIPDYMPVGDDAELRKLGAADINDKNASLKASELDGRLDQQIKDLEGRKQTR